MPDTSKLEKLNRELEKSEKKLRKAINDEKVLQHQLKQLTQTQNIPSRFTPAKPTMPLERTTAPSTGLIMTPFTVMCCGKSGNVPELP